MSYLYLSGIMPSTVPVFPDKHLSDFIPMNLTGPASVQVVYLCRYQQRKSLPQATISVIVATLSMFSGGWAVFMLIATCIVKRRYKHANVCLEHGAPNVPIYAGYDTIIFGDRGSPVATAVPYDPYPYTTSN
ncbi:hypothetical protein BD779DRAFT_1671768 [Infundibulicybe gibba]|nr:hypothetical protein BD779DRAFT_1671768 [Infundibulicybe gibba]